MPQIRTLCRIKPTAEYYPEFEASRTTLHLRVPEILKEYKGAENIRPRATVSHEFHFDYIFKNTATQEEVFDVAAKSIVDGFLNGYNGTIFAYGQTGTGKTYTVEGSAKQYKQRGLEPRSLSRIYKELEKRTEEDISIHISFLEIYQEVGYDLLNPGARTNSLVTPFPKVSVMEGQAGIWTVKNLSVHYAATEEVAQNLLLQGQANRRVAATAVHDRSSRSHAVLTIQLTSKKPGSDVLVRSKLHLVDLAGSERVSKTGAHGNLLNEAKCINLSLHYLESVIIALQGEKAPPSRRQQHSAGPPRGPNSLDKKRPHSADPTPRVTKYVPYRNSLLTMVLRDSLGGNCMTCMIATISLEYLNLGETLSTCRFAGRVACIANSVSRNEEVDEKSLVKKLRKRVAELETELACLLMEKEETNFTLELMNTKLTDEDKLECNKIIEKYVEGKVNDPVSEGITNPYKFRECMKILKKMVVDGVFRNPANQNPDGTVNIDVDNYNSPMIGSEVNAKRRHSLDETGDDRKRSHVDNTQINQSTSVQGHKSRPRHKETAVTIPITNAWGEDTYQSEPEQPIRRPRHRQRRRQNPPLTDPDTDKEEDKKKFDELRLSEMLAPTTRRRRHYKSPFEKKRIKEIKKLNEKVENMQQTQIDKEGELVQMKLNLAEQELNIMEEQIKTKLSVTEDQLADQQAYVQQLKADEADVQLIQKERMVEKQLRKKQEKANRKIEAIDEKRKQLHQHSEDVQNEISKAKPTLKDQYGKYRNRDGSLNTRQVFDMLRTEEKKQEKIQNQMEHERMLMLSQHLEMKEAATRQKLREFKDMLRMSHSAGFPEGHGGGENGYLRSITAPDYAEPVRSKAREEVGLDDIHGRKSPLRTTYTRETLGTYIQNNTEEPSARSAIAGESRLTEKPLAESSRPVSRQSVKSTKSVIPDSEFYAKKRQEKDPTVRWESPYSRPSTACSNVPPNIEVMKSVNGDDPEFGYGMTDDYKSTRASKRSARSELMPMDDEADDEMDVYETMMPSEYVYGMTPKDKFDGRKMGLASTTFDMALKQMLESQDQEMYPDHDGYDEFARTSQPGFSQSPAAYYSGADSNPYLQQMRISRDSSFDRAFSRKTKSRGKSSVHEPNKEYELQRIYGASQSRNQRKSRGRSRDRTMTSDDDEGIVSRSLAAQRQRDKSLDDWERRMLMKSRKATPVKPSINRFTDSENESPDRGKKKEGYSNWGPQTKHASIAGRLASMSLTSPGSSAKGSRKLEYDDMINDYFEPKPTNIVYEEAKSPRVKAIPDDEAESTYMEKLQVQKDRVSRIRKARHSAEVIQKAWRKYQARKKRF